MGAPPFVGHGAGRRSRQQRYAPLYWLFCMLSIAMLAPSALGAQISAPCTDSKVPDVSDTRLLHQPAISSTHIAFIYAGDLWVCDLDGRNVRRLTSDYGFESAPAFSPDGRLIAFSAQYDGSTDVFVVPVEGGIPHRLTWHPDDDVVQGFTRDGKAVLFASSRAVFTTRYTQLFTVSVDGGMPTRLAVPHAHEATYSPDGSHLAYTPLAPRHLQWKRYRGGTVSTIVVYCVSDHATEKIPQPAERANDANPMWMGDTIYFRSDRNGEFNIFAYDVDTKAVRQLTEHTDFPVLSASAADGRVVYEQAGWLHLLDTRTRQSKRLTIGVAADLVERRPRFVKGSKWIRNAAVSPTGARALFEFRGEIVTVPAEKGGPRYLTSTPSAHERSPAWSPDGKSVAYFSDVSGEYELHVRPQDGSESPKTYKLDGAGFYAGLVWSPDCNRIAFTDNSSRTLYVIDLGSGKLSQVAQQPIYVPGAFMSQWSPDSQWLAYTLISRAQIQSVHVYAIEKAKSVRITDGLSDVSEPVFDNSGKYLYFFASTDAGPVRDWFSQSNADMRAERAIYLAVLKKGLESPLAKESDEEKGPDEESDEPDEEDKEDEKSEKESSSTDEKDPRSKDKPSEPVVIDFDDLSQRIVALPIPEGNYRNLQVGEAGQIFFLRTADGKTALQRFDFEERKTDTILPEINDYYISFDSKKILYRLRDEWRIAKLAKEVEPPDDTLAVDRIQVKIDPPAEWQQMFDEAWRINRDYFYDPGMHGADWPAMRKKYQVFLSHLSHRSDLTRVIQWLCSELSVGHSFGGGGDTRNEPETVPGGLLGADFEVANGRYRFEKVYGGLNWNPELRSPLTEPGVDAQAGEYLLAVRGQDLRPPTNLHSLFENTADQIVEITVGPNPDSKGARTVKVVPVESEAALRNRDWVEGNLKKVTEATDGRVAYVYVPNTANLGHEYFKRYFFPQADRDAIIVDERFNGGGQVADYYIDILRRPFIGYWATRYGADITTPAAAVLGPKVMIIDETAGSGGDLLPWMFRKFELGTLVGKRTWGGLVGMLGYPTLMDGGTVTAPNLAFWTEEGWIVENEGVPPDVDVEQTPADVVAGRDPQLERAIQIVMEELEKNAPERPSRPPYPQR